MTSAATIVAFDPDYELRTRITAIAGQIERLYLVDNSAAPTQFGRLPANVSLHHNANVGGLAGALNFAIERAREDGFTRLFLFDQDTDVGPDFCATLAGFVDTDEMQATVVLGPRHINASTGYPVRLAVPRGAMSLWPTGNEGLIECMFLINSCSLLLLDRIPQDIHYDLRLPVDMSDVDFCLRLRNIGLRSTCVSQIHVRHGIGNRTPGAHKLSPTHYSALRKRSQIRGRIIVWRRHFRRFPRFVVTDAAIAVLDIARTLMFEDNRMGKLRAFALGTLEGIRAKIA